ncbi:phosphatase PAP2 family protein [Pseudokineococcus sp. 1T1Z-3]|uniref:phosphatase PAP2 family protein n=1 Tax=Pseudokineococcus sp. 1T1Z-3 TaxID=3132745 RepID=UPI0030A3E475
MPRSAPEHPDHRPADAGAPLPETAAHPAPRPSTTTTAVLAVVLLGTAVALAVLATPRDGAVTRWDVGVLRAVEGIREPWLTTAMTLATDTAGVAVIAVLLVPVLWLVRRGDRPAALLLAVGAAVAAAVSNAAKPLVDRARPDSVDPLVTAHLASFPSGHTMTAVGAYGVLAVLLARRGHAVLAAVSALWVLVVGLTRVYLGVHFPTDVLGSLAAGGVLLLVVARLDQRLAPAPA